MKEPERKYENLILLAGKAVKEHSKTKFWQFRKRRNLIARRDRLLDMYLKMIKE